MNLKQAKVTLDKINSLYKSMSMDEGSVSSIERDLMLSYIKKLYEAFLHDSSIKESTAAPEPTNVKEEVVVEKPKPKRTYKPPRIIEIPDSIQHMAQPKPTPKPPQPNPVPPPPSPQPNPQPNPIPQPEPEPKPDPTRGQSPSNSSFNGLFEFKEAKELSEKLSFRPIHDLTKALAINDRLLYMNELFGKDLNALNDALATLNRYSSLDEAKDMLVGLAEKYDWTSDDRQAIAKDFVQLVRRRYA
ncbi:MAG: hypothetical protein MI974_05885 [Chitinophagales bacterium]|nr:hypothetical protein [Chitinophagales bacterium]